MLFGYGRWNVIKLHAAENHTDYPKSQQEGVGLNFKSEKHLKAYSNSFIRSLASNLTYDMKHMQYFLLNLIEEDQDDFIFSVDPNDWDINQVRQRSNLNAKRIRFLYRVRRFIEIYDDYYCKKHGKKPESIFEYHKMLNVFDT